MRSMFTARTGAGIQAPPVHIVTSVLEALGPERKESFSRIVKPIAPTLQGVRGEMYIVVRTGTGGKGRPEGALCTNNPGQGTARAG